MLLSKPPCAQFIDAADIAKPAKAPSAKGREYCDAYVDGIRQAAPDQEFSLAAGAGAILGRIAAVHAKGAGGALLRGAELTDWFRRRAADFRRSTADRPELWGGWAPYHFERWLNMGGALRPTGALQPMPAAGLRVTLTKLGG